ncbi:hypothetical protein SCA03_24550 [Streptomyces cacaoi]|uniref:Uncharacterized protein n=1 Tax=Streptomyces cacaoi TaxID=1898 RepID=A0A4Y3QWZ0_STRCI|nr:hypothetical protein SCA03_24550 [Streptomyces cacaoi]
MGEQDPFVCRRCTRLPGPPGAGRRPGTAGPYGLSTLGNAGRTVCAVLGRFPAGCPSFPGDPEGSGLPGRSRTPRPVAGVARSYTTPGDGWHTIWRTLANPGECSPDRVYRPAAGYGQLSREPGGLT